MQMQTQILTRASVGLR